MPTSIEDLLSQLALHVPTVLFVAMLVWVLDVFYTWRHIIWHDRVIGIISDELRGQAPLAATLSAAIARSWPLSNIPTLYRWWNHWMDKRYGETETLGDEQAKGMARTVINQAKQTREIRQLGSMQLLLLAPLREELVHRAWLLVFSSLSYVSVVFILCSASLFSYMHWKNHATFVFEALLSWTEEREARTKRQDRIMAVSFTFVLGLLCGLVVVYTQSIWAAILIHMLWNYLLPRLYGLAKLGKLQHVDRRVKVDWKTTLKEVWKI